MECFENLSPLLRRRVQSCGPAFSRLRASGKAKFRVVVMGASAVGKSALIHRFVNGSVPLKYKPTVEDMHHKELLLGGTRVRLEVLDTSGSFPFPEMRRLSIRTGDVFLLVFSPHDPASLWEAAAIREQILQERGPDAPIVFISSKSDIKFDSNFDLKHKGADSVVDLNSPNLDVTKYCAESADDDGDAEKDDDDDDVGLKITEATVTIDWGHSFFTTSAFDDVNVKEAFVRGVLMARGKDAQNPQTLAERGRVSSLKNLFRLKKLDQL